MRLNIESYIIYQKELIIYDIDKKIKKDTYLYHLENISNY